MKAYFVLLVCVFIGVWFFSAAPAQDPAAPAAEPDQAILITDSSGLSCTLIITGTVVRKSEEPPSTETVYEAIIEKFRIEDVAFGHSSNPIKDDKIKQEMLRVITAVMKEPVAIDRIVTQLLPDDVPKIASFSMYVAVHHEGSIKYSSQTGAFFDKKTEGCTGLAQVTYNTPYQPTSGDESLELHCGVMQAFSSLNDQLKCDAIWIKVTEDDPVMHQQVEILSVVFRGTAFNCHMIRPTKPPSWKTIRED